MLDPRLWRPCVPVHVIPSADVTTVPVAPTATHLPVAGFAATPESTDAVPDVRAVHVMPSGDVEILPALPTATNSVPFQATW